MTDQPPPPAAPPPLGEGRWYLPSWGERLRLMKWRIIYFIPLILFLPVVVFFPFLVLFWWKVLIILIAIPATAAIAAARHAIRLRKEPFCIHCGYDLTSLPDGHICPECGIQFRLSEIDDYRRDPHWFIKRQSMSQRHTPTVSIDAGPRRSPKSRDGT